MRQIGAWVLWWTALLLALWLGYAAVRSDDMAIIVGLLLSFAAMTSFMLPQRPWRWGLFWGLSQPLSGLLFLALGLRFRYLTQPAQVLPSFLALVPAFLGAYLGAGARLLILPPHSNGSASPGSE